MKKLIKVTAIVLAAIIIIALVGDILIDSFVQKHSEKPGGDFAAYDDAFTLAESETRLITETSVYNMYTVTPQYTQEIYEHLLTLDDWKPLPIADSTRGSIAGYIFKFPQEFRQYLDFETASHPDSKGAWKYAEKQYDGRKIFTFFIFLPDEGILIQAMNIRYP